MSECPAPGIYKSIPAAEYHSWDAVSNSALNNFARSPWTYIWHQRNPKPSSDEMKIGSAVHPILLSPDELDDEVAVAPEINRRTKDGRAEWDAFLKANTHRTVLSNEQFKRAAEMAMAVREEPTAYELLQQGSEMNELSIVFDWDVPRVGPVRCKSRIDLPLMGMGQLADLKTSRDASKEGFKKAIWNYGYWRQAGFYCKAAMESGLMAPTGFIFIAVDSGAGKKPPYNCGCYALSEDAIIAGQIAIEQMLIDLRGCQDTDSWPSYCNGIEDVDLPPWAWNLAKGQVDMDIVRQSRGTEIQEVTS